MTQKAIKIRKRLLHAVREAATALEHTCEVPKMRAKWQFTQLADYARIVAGELKEAEAAYIAEFGYGVSEEEATHG